MKYLPILLLLLISASVMCGCDGDIGLRFTGGNADGDAVDADEDSSVHACTTGDLRCQGTAVEICTKSYTWVVSEDCALTGRQCVQGVCTGSGSDGDMNDDAGDTVEIDMVCDGNNDNDDTGVSDNEPLICSPGDLRCTGTAVEVCASSYVWVFLKDCGVTGQQCQNGQCVIGDSPEPCGGPCPEGYVCDTVYNQCVLNCPECPSGECCDAQSAPHCYACGQCVNPPYCSTLSGYPTCCPGYFCRTVFDFIGGCQPSQVIPPRQGFLPNP